MIANNNSVLGTAAAVLLSLVSQVSTAEAPLPAHPAATITPAEINAPVEPKYEPPRQLRALSTVTQAACDMNGYAQNSGQALVDHILQSDINCINNLYDGNATSFAAFTRQRMIDVADATTDLAADYRAADGDTSINKLFYFLRTGYFIEYYYPDDTEAFDDNVQTAVTAALDSLVGNSDFYSASSSHGDAIRDAIILMDSANEQARYIPVIKEWLIHWDQQAAQYSSMRSSVNGIFSILYRGHYNPTFVASAGSDNQLMQLLGGFARSDWMLEGSAQFMQENAARELSRFVQYTDAPAYSTIVAEVDAVLQHYSMTGTGSSVWLLTAGNVDYFGQCAQFEICGFAEELEQQVLAHNHTCSASLKIRAQDMTGPQMVDSCGKLSDQESYFHQLLATGYNPVADDLNEDLEVIVFDDWYEYDNYAPLFFGINTDNGGMYLEGNPANPENQARFIAHEADWLRPDFEVWNLTHEYVHYLDGRFNLHGDFGDARTGTHKTVWWIEGLAEYVSKKDYNDDAIALARTGQFELSEIFANDYGSGSDRVYKWGYLAVRFMFERHRDDVTQMLTHFRAGNYDGYLSYLNSIGSGYDSEWQNWLTQVQSTEDTGSDNEIDNNETISNLAVPTEGDDLHFYMDVPEGANRLSVAIDGGSGDADLYLRHGTEATDSDYACRPYIGGNTEVCDIDNPEAGLWYIRLKAYAPFSGVNLLASYTTVVDACTSGTPLEYGALELDRASCVAGSNQIRYFYVFVPEGTDSLDFALSGGDGNGDLYVNDETWATASDYDQVSSGPGNSESLSVSSPDSGWYYVSVIGDFSDTTIEVTAN
ncbi:M9 family metallopeptidase [Microbulbifer taiwanensis]|uniref:microbial collagenase n=1 Tax=Microbulbifer taiwanensis TaxID=986746 RepID=A0ABW1YSF0_9GAMM|nr:M9 family metallopeptidase [Microbulbifer taiwanensis]